MEATKKIVITGAYGFLGRHLTKKLVNDRRYVVTALTSRPEEMSLKYNESNITCLHKDYIVGNEAENMLRDAIVVNCAYPRNTDGYQIADGLNYIQQLFEISARSKAAGIINISSQSVYSQQRTAPATEVTPVFTESVYAIGKFATELLLESICWKQFVPYTNLRMASLIGPGFDQRIVNRFVRQAMETGRLTVKRNRQKFGFFDVQDAADGIAAMIETPPDCWLPIYNLGRNDAYTLMEMADVVSAEVNRLTGKEIHVQVEDGTEESDTSVDAGRFCGQFHFSPKSDLKSSVRAIIQNELSLSVGNE